MEIVTVWIGGICVSLILLSIQVIVQGNRIRELERKLRHVRRIELSKILRRLDALES